MIFPCDLDSKEIAKEYHDCQQELESIYTYIADDISCDVDSKEIAKEYHDCKEELESIYTYIVDDISM